MANADHAISFKTTCTEDNEIRGGIQACVKNGRTRATAQGATDDAIDHAPADVQESDAHGHAYLDRANPGLSAEGAISRRSVRSAEVLREEDCSLMAQEEGVQMRQQRLVVGKQ
eukprot:gene31526-38105_t